MKKELVLQSVCDFLNLTIEGSLIKVKYKKVDDTLFSAKGFKVKYGHSVGAHCDYLQYFAIDVNGTLLQLESEEEQTNMGCDDFGITKECASNREQLISMGIIPQFIITDEYWDADSDNRIKVNPERTITVYSF